MPESIPSVQYLHQFSVVRRVAPVRLASHSIASVLRQSIYLRDHICTKKRVTVLMPTHRPCLSALCGVATGAGLVLLPLRMYTEPHVRRKPGDVKAVQKRADPAAVGVDQHLFVFGVVCNERKHEWRGRLRKLYAAHAPAMLPIFVLDDRHQADARWMRRERAVGGLVGDDMLFVRTAWHATHVERHHAYREAHCAHKTMGWWQSALRWPSRWYGKTDDDAVIDLPPLRSLLARLPSGPVYGGIVHYSSVNTSNLEGGCFSPGAWGAVRARTVGRAAARCAALEGPYPYVEGPLEILSPDVAGFLGMRAERDGRQRCHFEDLYVGRYIAAHPALSLVNLDSMLGHKDVWHPPSGAWLGADSFLAHWVRTDEAFGRVTERFAAARALRHPDALALRCSSWRRSFSSLAAFPCCHNWTLCEPATPLLRARSGARNITSTMSPRLGGV